MRGLILFPVQLIGSIVAAALVSCILPGDIKATRTVLAPGMSQAQGVFFEMFLTSFLVLTILMLAAEKSKDTFMAPIGIGLSMFVAELAGMLFIKPFNSQSLIDLKAYTTPAAVSIPRALSVPVLLQQLSTVVIGSTGWVLF
jgi:hypothetical protein